MVLANQEQRARLGITVTKRVKRAVDRNRIKRLLREVFRRNRRLFPEQSDVVAIARLGAEKLDYLGMREEIRAVDQALDRVARQARPTGERAGDRGKARQS